MILEDLRNFGGRGVEHPPPLRYANECKVLDRHVLEGINEKHTKN